MFGIKELFKKFNIDVFDLLQSFGAHLIHSSMEIKNKPIIKYVWFDGKIKHWWEIFIHILSSGLHYGNGVFEGIRVYDGKIFRLHDHVERLFKSAELAMIKIPYTKKEISDAIIQTVKKNKLKNCYIRPLIYLGYGPMGLYTEDCPVHTAIICFEWGAYMGDGLTKGIKVEISEYQRFIGEINHIKSTSYGLNRLAKMKAIEHGFQDAILFNVRGFLAELSAANIFIVKNGIIYTPKTESCLKGITRLSIIELARFYAYEVIEKDIIREELFNADEVYCSGTAAELTPIIWVNDQKIGNGEPGKITMILQAELFNVLYEKIDMLYNNFSEWFTLV